MRVDLHVHTRWSDGSMPVEEVVAVAACAGLAGLAITDHDSMAMIPTAQQVAQRCGIELIPGMELSTIDHETGRKVHILVYFPQDDKPLIPIFEAMAEKRNNAGRAMIKRVCSQFPVSSKEIEPYYHNSISIFRVHLVRALIERGYDSKVYGRLYRELFVEPGGSCFVPVEYTDMYEAAHAARLSGGVVVLAHPDVYDSFDAASRLAQAGLLDGLECDYPRHRLDSAQRHWVLVEQYGLIPTGGTDFHGFYGAPPNPIGTCGVETNVVARLRKAVGERMQ